MSHDNVIPVADVRRRYLAAKSKIDAAISEVLDSGRYILGRKVERFENAFAEYLGVRHVVGCASGTDAISLALMACGIGRGDEVLTVSATAVPTASGISAAGAVPGFVEIDPVRYTMDPDAIETRLTAKTRAILPVHLYGQPADMTAINAVARRRGLKVIEDVAQAHGARLGDRAAGGLSDVACFSFYPTKNLGTFGDGGACATDDDDLAERLRRLRNYGQRNRFEHEVIGLNSRLDEIQAAALMVLLPELESANHRRREIAEIYDAAFEAMELAGRLRRPIEAPNCRHVYHLYPLRLDNRDEFRDFLEKRGVSTQIHYPIPVHLQQAYSFLGHKAGDFPETERHSQEVVSLPMFPELSDAEVGRVNEAVTEFFGR